MPSAGYRPERQVKANITNSGSVAGTDVVQLYLHEDDTTILEAVKKLEGFRG